MYRARARARVRVYLPSSCAQEDETDDLSWEDASFAEREID